MPDYMHRAYRKADPDVYGKVAKRTRFNRPNRGTGKWRAKDRRVARRRTRQQDRATVR